MLVFGLVFAVALVGFLLRGRRARKSTLAGLNPDRPQHVLMREPDPGSGVHHRHRGSGGNL